MKKQEHYRVIGLMSGTSLDGLDIAYCLLDTNGAHWSYKIQNARTIPYSPAWRSKLAKAHKLSGEQLTRLSAEFGAFMGAQVKTFMNRNRIRAVDLIASHGHTVFHQPQRGFTLQIGDGATLAAVTGFKTICDFRSGDVALGGQGAPLVPVGDELLFEEYDACLNLGGIANISFNRKGKRVAFDICPVNLLLNHFANKRGLPYDKGGRLAASGSVHWPLLEKLNANEYYRHLGSKSLGREWIEKNMLHRLDVARIPAADKLATASEHAAIQIARVLNHFKIEKVLLTGGGTFNKDLVERTGAYSNTLLVVPDPGTVMFKEALIFALLGVLRDRNEVNCLAAVTGARQDSVGGAVYCP